jgi:hypothetical protein
MNLDNLTEHLNCTKNFDIKQDFSFEVATRSDQKNGTFCTSTNVNGPTTSEQEL